MTDTTTTQADGPQPTQAAAAQPAAIDTAAPAVESSAAPEAQATETQTAEKPAETVKQGAPETYDLTTPDGATMDEGGLKAFTDFAKDADLTNEAAQKLLDKLAPATAARQADQIAAIRAQWTSETMADKEIGGDKHAEHLAVAQKALQQFGTPELNKWLTDTGLGNHPELIRAFYRAGKAISEDSVLVGKAAPTRSETTANALYPNQSK